MQYAMLLYFDEAAATALSAEEVREMSPAYAAYSKALVEAGAMRGGERLKPSNMATTVRIKDGRTQVLDGPYADTKEQLGGFYLIDAPDIDAAIAWAARCPTASQGTVEVRPIWPMDRM